jgi:hypothetical protein
VSDPTVYGDAQMTPSGGLPRRVPRKVEAFSISRGWPRRTVAVGGVAVVPGGEGVGCQQRQIRRACLMCVLNAY